MQWCHIYTVAQQQLISISIQKRQDRKQMMPLIIILGWINALPRIQGYVSGLRPSSNPYMLGRALIQPKIITLGIICINYLCFIDYFSKFPRPCLGMKSLNHLCFIDHFIKIPSALPRNSQNFYNCSNKSWTPCILIITKKQLYDIKLMNYSWYDLRDCFISLQNFRTVALGHGHPVY